MKLIKIHIDNFGKLSNFDLDFDERITSICEDNGKGKTTIATFIVVMLYGMNKNLKEQKDRERFFPFNGGTYGGKLVFSHEGDTYEVRRQFHKTSKAKDTLHILKNKQPYELVDDQEIGEAIFGIDESAFRRVCFIDDNGLDFSQESISSKLGGLAGDFDAVKVEETLDKLTDSIKEIKPLRGNGGLLGSAETNLASIQYEIGRLNDLQQPLLDAQKEYHEAIEQRRKIRASMSEMQEIALNEERKKNAQIYFTSIQQRQKAYEDLLALYPKGIPTAEEINQVRNAQHDIKMTQEEVQDLTAEELERLRKLSIRFVEEVPTQQILAEMNNNIRDYESLNAALASSNKPREAEEDIVRRFSSNPPSEGEVSKIREKLQAYKDVSHEYENTDSTLSKNVTKTVEIKANKTLSIVLLAIGGSLIIGGIISCFFLIMLGIVLIVVGLITVAVGILMLLKGAKTQQVTEEERVVNPKKQSLGEKRDDIRREIAIWLSRYYINDPDPISGMAKFESEYRIYLAYLQGQKEAKERIEESNKKISGLRETISSFFKKYGYNDEEYRTLLLALQKDIGDYESLRRRKEAREASKTRQADIRSKAEETIKIFCAKYNVAAEALSEWLINASAAEQSLLHAKDAIKSAQDAYNNYIKDNPVKDIATPETTLEDLQAQEAALNQTIAEKRTTIDSLEKELESLDTLLHDEEELKNKIAELKRRHKILVCVKKNIEYAQDTIKEKYVGPIKKEFERYSKLIREASGLSIDLDANLELRYLANGEYRKSLHLSDGERMLVSFCLRLALLENMYKGSEIFAILDDPFVTLDGTNLPKVLNSIGKLNGSTQILYFTCHQSRMPNK